MRKQFTRCALLAAMAVAMPIAMAQDDHAKEDSAKSHATPAPERAIAVLFPTEGNDTHGIVHFEKVSEGVQISARIEGLEPNKKHGFHIHQYGDMTSADGTAMGGHYDPQGKPHGAPDDKMRHVGDFGNLEADENGVATYERVDEHISLEGENSILGRGMVVHGGTDDLKSQPSGDAGPRIAQGVIGADANDDES